MIQTPDYVYDIVLLWPVALFADTFLYILIFFGFCHLSP